MKAVVYKDSSTYLEERELTPLASDQIRVKIHHSAICRTDIAVSRGAFSDVPTPLILGHEAAGEIDEIGSSIDPGMMGMRVAIIPIIDMFAQHCENIDIYNCLGIFHDGAFAQYITLKSHQVIALPDSTSTMIGVFAEPIAAALGIFETPIERSMEIAVLGDSRFGKLYHTLLTMHGYSSTSLIPHVNSESAERFDVVIETQADIHFYEEAARLLKRRGTLILKSRNPQNVSIPLTQILNKQLTLVGAGYGRFAEAVELLTDPRLSLESHIGKIYRLDDFKDAFLAAESENKKILFDNQK